MNNEYIAPIVMTCIWALVGIVMPIFARGPNKGIIQCCLMLTGVTCWLFWLCCWLAQLNPLIGPKLTQHEIMIVAREWGNRIPPASALVSNATTQ